MKTSSQAWDEIYKKACKIAEKYKILNVPITKSTIFIFYQNTGFYTQEDYEKKKGFAKKLKKISRMRKI